MRERVNLLGLDQASLTRWLAPHTVSPISVASLFKALHQHSDTDFASMDFLNKATREYCQQHAYVALPKLVKAQVSSDGTRKWLLQFDDNNIIETVFIPEKNRGTLCISSQVGCALNCRFCATAQQGFTRHLSAAEIIGQLHFAKQQLTTPDDPKPITNVVFMGMGEPLLNLDNVVTAIRIMLDDCAYGLAKRRVTVSTSGVVPAMYRLREATDVALAVSLHAPNDALRNQLVPINRKYPLAKLLSVCREYFADQPQRDITIEYVMLADINDTDEHAQQLCECLRGIPVKVNLIPFNPIPNVEYRCSSEERIQQFQQTLQQAGYPTIVRRTRGDDIAAACGQLVGKLNRESVPS